MAILHLRPSLKYLDYEYLLGGWASLPFNYAALCRRYDLERSLDDCKTWKGAGWIFRKKGITSPPKFPRILIFLSLNFLATIIRTNVSLLVVRFSKSFTEGCTSTFKTYNNSSLP